MKAFTHYTNRLKKIFTTPLKDRSYRCFRSFRPQVNILIGAGLFGVPAGIFAAAFQEKLEAREEIQREYEGTPADAPESAPQRRQHLLREVSDVFCMWLIESGVFLMLFAESEVFSRGCASEHRC